jgi:hypothetical protein
MNSSVEIRMLGVSSSMLRDIKCGKSDDSRSRARVLFGWTSFTTEQKPINHKGREGSQRFE